MHIREHVVIYLCVLLAQAMSGFDIAAAEDSVDVHPLLKAGFSVDIGIFYPDRELNLRVDGTVGRNEDIDFDTGLNLGKADEIFAGELAWRFRNNWSFLAQHFRSSDSTSLTLNRDIEWRDVVFGADTGATVGTELTLTRLFVGRQLSTNNPRHDVGIGGGLHWLSIGAFVQGTIVINGASQSARRSVSADAPLPNIGAWYRYSISPKWAFRARYDLLSANVGDYEGLLQNASVGLNYQVFRNIGLGVAYNYFELDVRVDRSNWRGKIETIYDGAYIYASAHF